MSNNEALAALDTVNSRLRQGRAVAEALLLPYIQQKAGDMDHELSPELMCDALSALCDMLEQGVAASAGIRGVQVV